MKSFIAVLMLSHVIERGNPEDPCAEFFGNECPIPLEGKLFSTREDAQAYGESVAADLLETGNIKDDCGYGGTVTVDVSVRVRFAREIRPDVKKQEAAAAFLKEI